MDGNHVNIEEFFMNIGKTDITIRGDIDDFPAIIHQTSEEVNANLFVFFFIDECQGTHIE